MSRRMLRIASVIRAVLAEAIRERLSDPRIEQLTSITHVEVSADLSVARVYVSVMAPEARQKLTLEALKHASGRLRTLVAQELTVRQTPQITFRLDESLQRGFETVQQIDRIMLEHEPASDEAADFDQSETPVDDPARLTATKHSSTHEHPDNGAASDRGADDLGLRNGPEDT